MAPTRLSQSQRESPWAKPFPTVLPRSLQGGNKGTLLFFLFCLMGIMNTFLSGIAFENIILPASLTSSQHNPCLNKKDTLEKTQPNAQDGLGGRICLVLLF